MKIIYNARVYTLDKSCPVASAIVIDNGRILAVGEEDDLTTRFEDAEKHDLGAGIILPGLIDAHAHLQRYALSLKMVNCETESLEDCLHRVERTIRNSQPGEWVLGHGWNQNDWAAWPSASELDTIAPNNPVFLTAKSLHAAWTNSLALSQANVNEDTPDPDNGHIQRDSSGHPTGILLESAAELVKRTIPDQSVDEVAQAIEQAQSTLWQLGVTGMHDFDQRACFMALQRLHANKLLKLRITKSIPVEDLHAAVRLGLISGFGDDFLRIGPIKIFMDGALGPRTAAMFQPYLNEPVNRGILNMDAEQLFEIGCQAVEGGLSLAVHAIGDRANHEALNAFQKLRQFEVERNLLPLRHRIEHVQILHPGDANRLAQLDIIASMQPVHATSDMYMADEYWGERSNYSYAWKTQLKHGAVLAFGSDTPVESPNPFLGLHAAVTRRRPDGMPGPGGWYGEQRITLSEALEGYSYGPAYAAGMEYRLGKLAPGYCSDLIVLDQDPFEIEPAGLLELKPLATMVAGDWVWRS